LTQLGTASNCSAIADLNALQITAANTKCFQQPFPSKGCSQLEFFNFLHSVLSCLSNIRQLNFSEIPQPGWSPLYIGPERTQQKTPPPLHSNSPGIVDVFTGRYQATCVHSRDRCITTVLRATVYSYFMEPESSLPRSQEPSTNPVPEPDHSL
jgi:hypothetical protein